MLKTPGRISLIAAGLALLAAGLAPAGGSNAPAGIVPAAPKYTVKRFTVNTGDAGNPFFENVYILLDPVTSDAVLIDPGAADPRIEAFIAASRLRLGLILNTHGHADHTRGNRHYASFYKVRVAGPSADAKTFEPGANRPDDWLEADASITVGSLAIRLIATPGHTPGSSCFLAGDNLFSGDTLFRGSIGKPCGNSDRERDRRQAEEIAGIRGKLLALPVTTWVWPGHGPMTTILDEGESNPFLVERK